MGCQALSQCSIEHILYENLYLETKGQTSAHGLHQVRSLFPLPIDPWR